MESSTRQLAGVGFAKIASLAMLIMTQILLARFLGPAGLGSYAIAIMVVSLLSIIFVVGCDVASSYLVASGYFSIAEGVTYTLFYGGIGSTVAMLVGLGVLQLPFSIFEMVGELEIYLALFTIPVTLFATVFPQLFTAIGDYKAFVWLSILNSVLVFLLSLILLWCFSLDVLGAILAVLLSGFSVLIVSIIRFRMKYKVTLCRPEKEKMRRMFDYGIKYHLGKISNTANAQLGTLFLAFFMDKQSVGVFHVALGLITRVVVIPDTLFTFLTPRAAAANDGCKELIARSARFTGLICGSLLVMLFILAEPLVVYLYSRDFIEAAYLIQVMTVGVFLRCVSKIFVPYFLGVNHPEIASFSVAAGISINLLAYIVLLPWLGLLGAAISTVLGYFCSSMILIFMFEKYSGIGFYRTWLLNQDDTDLVKNSFSKVFN